MMSSDNAAGTDFVAAPAPGAMVYFRGTGETTRGALEAAVTAAGWSTDVLPPLPSTEVALHRAVDKEKDKRRLVRPCAGGGGWALVDELLNDDGVPVGYDHANTLTVKRDGAGGLVFSSDEHPLAQSVRDGYAQALKVYLARDINVFLVNLVRSRMSATCLNDGHYFVPARHLPTLIAWKNVMAAAGSNKIYMLRAEAGEDTVEAILDAIVREAETETAAMERELDGAADDLNAAEGGATSSVGLGKRALKTRFSKLDALSAKLVTYEEILGKSLDSVRTRVTNVHGLLVVAQCAIDAEEDAEKLAAAGLR